MTYLEMEVQVADKEVRGNFNPHLFREKERDYVGRAFPLRELCRQDYDFIQDVSSYTKLKLTSNPDPRGRIKSRFSASQDRPGGKHRCASFTGSKLKHDQAGLIFFRSDRYPIIGETARNTSQVYKLAIPSLSPRNTK